MSDIKYAYPLILNKVASPQYATPVLRRARLLEWLNEAANCRAVVIAADAGYGKTTLLWQWEREVTFPCYWYKLDRTDRDWTFHISYLIEAISKHHRGFGRRAHSMLQQMGGPGSSRPGVTAYLLAEMHQRLTEPCTFIIDDWQYVNATTEVRGVWNQILRDAPATCRFVFASRVKPTLQFARFKTHGGYAELRTDALRFTEPEIAELFRDVYNDPLEPSQVTELERRTEGWAASLQLVEVSLRERPTPEERSAFIRSITAENDGDLFSFLAEEVVDQQSEETRNFLLSTSILQQITPEVAERLTGVNDGRRELVDLEHRGLFTNRLDDVRFRYHNLFREFLERRLISERSEAEVAGLHIHAASYFETTEQWPEAIHHYLRAGLHRQAARLIARYGEDVVAEGRLGLVDEWLEQLPADTIRTNARLSLLYGETCGIKGDWGRALEALERARTYFIRKGDKRFESLACLKLSSVFSNYGDPDRSAEMAQAGLDAVPPDAHATRLRLEGNLALTRIWLTEPLDSVLRECRRVDDEATRRGLDHFAAIAKHNAGAILRRMGRLREAVHSLQEAARFWSESPTSPFADNFELVTALLYSGDPDSAARAATDGSLRTAPWPRPHSLALVGLARVHSANGRFAAAIAVLEEAMKPAAALGPAVQIALDAMLIENMFLGGESGSRIGETYDRLLRCKPDPRDAPEWQPAVAIARHVSGSCGGTCLSAVGELSGARRSGATSTALISELKIGPLLLEHGGRARRRQAWETLTEALDADIATPFRHWVRLYAPHSQALLEFTDGTKLLVRIASTDPEGWREAILAALEKASDDDRVMLLGWVVKHANRDTVEGLRLLPGRDVAEARRLLQHQRATHLFLRTFGTVGLHRGDWAGAALPIDKKRVRTLLGVLATGGRGTLTRDMVIDTLWPDTDADAAINNLNQTVFQLRRCIDPNYRGGDSPEYVISNADHVGLNPDLVRTDLDEIRALHTRLPGADWHQRQALARRTIDLVRGEFLADLRYEDWTGVQQLAVHREIRDILLPIAAAPTSMFDVDVSERAAGALVGLDPFDEPAMLALANCLALGGRRVAARNLLTDYARRLRAEIDEDPSQEFQSAAAEVGTTSQPTIDRQRPSDPARA